jgi:aspartyl-tRNA(Asn)/glutamyl-tRNA(Gln) amidotransferase subunit A
MHSDLAIPATSYINALRLRGRIQRVLDDVFARYDAIVTPTLSTVAGPIDKPFAEWSRGFSSTSIGGAGNAAGVPAISIPNGLGADGLPTGLQFVGRAFEENRILAIAAELQRRTDWHTRHPDV